MIETKPKSMLKPSRRNFENKMLVNDTSVRYFEMANREEVIQPKIQKIDLNTTSPSNCSTSQFILTNKSQNKQMDLRNHIFDIQMDNNYQECDTFDVKQGSVLDSLCRSHENLNYETTGGNHKPTASSNHQVMFKPLP